MFQSVYEHALGLSPMPDCADTSAYDGDYFGVFVGVTRSAAHAVADWPQNIHGSIGYWDRDFKRVEPEPLCAHTHRVALDAAVNDDRKRYFPDLLTDIEAVLDVKFMCLPVHELDARAGSFADGSIFDNDEWGLLVQTPSGRGATFLPKVYHTDWTAIKSKLVSKAGLQPGEPMRFFAYRTKRSARSVCQIYSRTQPRKLLTKIGCCFLKFVNGCAHVPYAVTAQHAVVYDETQDVRNIATLLDVRKLSRVLPCKARTFSRDTAHYVRKYLANPESMRQASSFLLPLLQELRTHPKLQVRIARRLRTRLETLEPEFELGEALVALGKKRAMRAPRSVFELNWQAQAWPRRVLHDPLRRYARDFDSRTETNFLAVAFEAACALRMFTLAHRLFCQLMQRYDGQNGLFKFLDGSSRVDITCHVHGGFMQAVRRD
jgi:hypothetical protein